MFNVFYALQHCCPTQTAYNHKHNTRKKV